MGEYCLASFCDIFSLSCRLYCYHGLSVTCTLEGEVISIYFYLLLRIELVDTQDEDLSYSPRMKLAERNMYCYYEEFSMLVLCPLLNSESFHFHQ